MVFLDGYYKLKRLAFDNDLFNVTPTASITVNSNPYSLAVGFYTPSQLATQVQTVIRNEDAVATVAYDSIQDKFDVTSAVDVHYGKSVGGLLGMLRVTHVAGTYSSDVRPDFAPYNELEVQLEGTREIDKFVVTTDAPYASRAIFDPPYDVVLYFYGIEEPEITCTSRGEAFELRNAVFFLEAV